MAQLVEHELAAVVEVEGEAHRVDAYPALVDGGDSVAIRLLATAAEQDVAMWGGTRRLIALNLAGVGRLLRNLPADRSDAAAITVPPASGVACMA